MKIIIGIICLLVLMVGCNTGLEPLLEIKCEELKELKLGNMEKIEGLNTDFGYNYSYEKDINGYNELCGDITGIIEYIFAENTTIEAPELSFSNYSDENRLFISGPLIDTPQGIIFTTDYIVFSDGNLTLNTSDSWFDFSAIDFMTWNIANESFKYTKELS